MGPTARAVQKVRTRCRRDGVLTALDGVGGHLQRQRAAAGLRDVHPEHQPHASVLPANVRLPLAQLDVRVPELQDPGTVDAAQNKNPLPAGPIPRARCPSSPFHPPEPPGQDSHTPGTGHTLPSTPAREGGRTDSPVLLPWSPVVHPQTRAGPQRRQVRGREGPEQDTRGSPEPGPAPQSRS